MKTNTSNSRAVAAYLAVLCISCDITRLVRAAASEQAIVDVQDLADTLDPYTESVPTILSEELNLDLDTSVLGVEGLDAYEGRIEVTVDNQCQYTLMLEFKKPADLPEGEHGFTGVCSGNKEAPNGQPYHKQTQHWQRLSLPMKQATGIDHIVIDWKPCGDNPPTLRQPRWDIVSYYVPPEYRTIMTCPDDEMATNAIPPICSPLQSTDKGRAMFSLPVLWQQVDRIANMPIKYFPNVAQPQAVEYEGLLSYNPEQSPATVDDVILPRHHMSSYDGDVISSRMIVPFRHFQGTSITEASGAYAYVQKSKKRLAKSWAAESNKNNDGLIRIRLSGESGLCQAEYNAAVASAISSP